MNTLRRLSVFQTRGTVSDSKWEVGGVQIIFILIIRERVRGLKLLLAFWHQYHISGFAFIGILLLPGLFI